MEMKVDPSCIREYRERRAWSQEHLAEVTGLGLRTIQRIEKTGTASYESLRSLAAVFDVDVTDLADESAAGGPRLSVPLRPLLGTIAALVAGAALFVAANSFADQVLLDVSVMLKASDETREGIETSEWMTQMIVDDGTLVPEVNDLRLLELRFTIVPKLLPSDRILIEMQIFELQGEGEALVSSRRHVVADGKTVEVVTGDEARSFTFSVTPRRQPRPLL